MLQTMDYCAFGWHLARPKLDALAIDLNIQRRKSPAPARLERLHNGGVKVGERFAVLDTRKQTAGSPARRPAVKKKPSA
jgi:hypothetical protein